MDANEKHKQLEEMVAAVEHLVNDIIHRRDRAHHVKMQRLAVLMWIRMAYNLGAQHAMMDFIEGRTVIGSSN